MSQADRFVSCVDAAPRDISSAEPIGDLGDLVPSELVT